MKVFYWTGALAEYPKRFYTADSESNFATEVPASSVGPDMLSAMIDDGYTEISSDTAYKLGLPT